MKSPILKSILKNRNLDDVIHEGGANLSGGEKQKIAIVRALLKKPDVLILDEVCSNIDKDTSNEIYKLIEEDKDDRITIIISHDELPEDLIDKKLELKKVERLCS